MMASPWPGLVTYVMVSKPTLFLQAFPRGGQGERTGSAHEGPMCSPSDRSHIKRNSGPPQSWCCRMETESACTCSILPGSSKAWKHAFLLLVPSPFVPHMVGLTPVYSWQSRTFVCPVRAKANTRLFISAIIDRKEGFGSDGFHLFITMWFFFPYRSKLSFKDLGEDDLGIYSCIVTDTDGVSSSYTIDEEGRHNA